MAKNGKANGNGTEYFEEDPPRATTTDGEGNNSEARLKAEAEAIEKWCELQDKEDALIKLHLDPIRKEKSELKSGLKSDYEIPIEAFNARAMQRRIERKSENDEVVLALNELYKAIPVGHNVDMVAALERVNKKKAEKAAAAAAKKTKATSTEATL